MRQVCGYLSSKRASFVKFCSDAPENPMVRLAIYGKAVQSRGFFRKKPGKKTLAAAGGYTSHYRKI